MPSEIHKGGCACGAVRYETEGDPFPVGVCHCRYCQTRTGSAFGISVYFDDEQVSITQGVLAEYSYQTESGGTATNRFCPKCGTTLFEKISMRPDKTSITGGTFDPPTFWYDITREVFCRTKAPFVSNAVAEKHLTFPAHEKRHVDRDALAGGLKPMPRPNQES